MSLDIIERAVQLWSNPNDTIYDPFGGIGSTGYVALKNGRRAIMSELKESYYKQNVLNCEAAISASNGDLFTEAA
jgi:DNA modification methylase